MINRSTLRPLLTLAVLLGLPPWAASQTSLTTGPYTVNNSIEYTWDTVSSPDLTTITLAAAAEVRARVDSTTGTFVLIAPDPGVTCVAVTTPLPGFRCVRKLPQALVTLLNAPGTHTLTLARFAGGVEGPSGIPFASATLPAAPTGVRLIP